MINLITGVPGSGKTAYALQFMQQQMKEGRKLFVHGIPDLKLPHIDVYCSSPNCDVCTTYTDEDKQNMHPANDWNLWAPEGAVLFFDEVQNIYRPRSSGSKVPDSIQAFEVHRHKGLDFYLITQSPKLFDSNIRELISRHIHLKQTWTGRYQFEWPETKLNTQSTSDAIKSSYKLNSSTFKLYKSASLHTKQQRRIPSAIYVLGFCIVGIGYVGVTMATKFGNNLEGSDGDSLESTASTSYPDSPNIHQIDQVDFLDFKPLVKGVLESAPAYSDLVVVKDFPIISACISGKDTCVCYTQQLTIYPATLQQCLNYINRDITSFNPYINVAKDKKDKLQFSRSASIVDQL